MRLDEYQQEAMRTAAGLGEQTVVRALGLCGEAGEVADLLKKHIGHGHVLDYDNLRKELGDVLWYVATLAAAFDMTLEEVATENVRKLRARYPDGFSVARSVNREGEL